jgi:cobalamin biosynthesis Co2+ chelatase CbiK
LIHTPGTAYIDRRSLTLERIDAAKADHIANREERNAEALEKAQKKLTQRRT